MIARLAPAGPLAPAVPPLSPVMVGRDAQLRELQDAYAAACQGRGQVVVVTGEAGVGKTRLVQELTGPLRGSPHTEVLEGRCREGEPAVPYGPFRDVLRAAMQGSGRAQVLRTVAGPLTGLGRLLPELDGGAAPGADLERTRLYEAVLRALHPGPGGACRVVVLEDLHASDQASRELSGFIARRVRDARILLLATCRTSERQRVHPLGSLATGLLREPHVREVCLGPLPREAVREMVQAIAGRALPPGVVAEIHRVAEGNPFYTEEITRPLRDGAGLRVPAAVRQGILARVLDLGAPVVEVLRCAAVIGREFGFEPLRGLAGVDEGELLRRLEAAVLHELVDELPDGETFTFRQALVREAVYGDMLRLDRRRRHARVLAALEAVHAPGGGEAVHRLAYHAVQAGDGARTLAYGRAAGDRAFSLQAFREAEAHYRAALGALPRDALTERAELLEKMGAALDPLGEAEAYARCCREAQRLYLRAGDRVRAGNLLRRQGEAAWQQGDVRGALADVREAVRMLEAEPHGTELAVARTELAAFHLLCGGLAESEAWGRKALCLSQRLGDAGAESYARNWVGCALAERGDTEGGIEHLRTAVRLGVEAGAAGYAIRAYSNLGVVLASLGEFRDGAQALRDGAAYADAMGWELGRGRLPGNLGRVEMELGHWDHAEGLLRRALQAAECGYPAARLTAGPRLAELLLRRGRVNEAAAVLDEVVPECRRHGEPGNLRIVDMVLARLHLARGELEAAAGVMDGCVGAWREQASLAGDVDLLGEAVGVYLRAGRPDAARDVHARLRRRVAGFPTPLGRARLADACGCLALWRGDADAAEHLEQAADAWNRMGLPFQEARARRHRAEALLRAGHAEHARADAARATAAFRSLGAEAELDLALAVAEGCGDDPSPAPSIDAVVPAAGAERAAEAGGLSRREREVLLGLAAGHSNQRIASESFVSVGTVKTHVHRILGKLGARNRTEAVALARTRGLLP